MTKKNTRSCSHKRIKVGHYHDIKLAVQEKRVWLCGFIADVVQGQSGVSRLVIFSQSWEV